MSLLSDLPSIASIHDDVPAVDGRAETASITAATPVPPEFQRAFLSTKTHAISTNPTLRRSERSRNFDAFNREFSLQRDIGGIGLPTKLPVPGGVGYGTFYTSEFKRDYSLGAEIAWVVICPNVLGGESTNFLYLTATNRTAFGVEALVGYQGQTPCWFAAYDWSVPPDQDRWVVSLKNERMHDYTHPLVLSGLPVSSLPIYNSTKKVGSGVWRNEVLLKRTQDNQWESVYQRDYQTSDEAQKNAWVGSWGPIVEAFDPKYVDTHTLGAWNVQTRSADTNGNWSPWASLSPDQATLSPDSLGFSGTAYADYYNWTVTS